MRYIFLALLIPFAALGAGKIINADIAPSGTANIAFNKMAASTAHNACTFDSSGFIAGGVSPSTNKSVFTSNGTDWINTITYDSTSSASTIVQRDANQNAFANNFVSKSTNVVSAGGTTTLTAASSRLQNLTGSSTQTFVLPDATTLSIGSRFEFDNNSSGLLTIQANGGGAVGTVQAGGYGAVKLTANSVAAGVWDIHYWMPNTVAWGTSGLNYTGTLQASGAVRFSNYGAGVCTFDASGNISSVAGTPVTAMSPFGSSPNANGGTISGGTLTLQPADATNPGGVSTTTQTLAGAKTFSSAPTFSTMTLGSVLFAGTGGLLSQDNSNFFWDATNHKLGIGTTTPRGYFDVLNTADSLLASPTIAGAGGSDNNSWLFYASTGGTLSIWNRNQLLHGIVINTLGNLALGGGGAIGHPVSTVVVSNQPGTTTTPTFTILGLAAQTADLQQWLDSSETVISKVDSTGKGFFPNAQIGTAGSATGTIGVSGSTSGTVTIQPQAAAGTYNFNLPTSAGSSGQPLLSGGGGSTPMSFGTLGVAGGGTGLATLTAHALYVGNGTSAPTALSVGASNTVLHGNSGADPSFSAVSLTADVSGTLPIANGGTGQTAKAAAFDALSPMTTGGDLIYGGASGTGTRLANGSAGQYLASGGGTAAPVWTSFPRSQITVIGGNGNGSGAHTQRYTTTRLSTGSNITYADSSTNGGQMTIVTAGVYAVNCSTAVSGGTANIGIAVNDSAKTTDPQNMTYAQGLRAVTGPSPSNSTRVQVSWTGILAASDIVTCKNDNASSVNDDTVMFNVVQVSN